MVVVGRRVYLIWINTGEYGWHPVACRTWDSAALCYRTLIRFGAPVSAVLVTRQVAPPLLEATP